MQNNASAYFCNANHADNDNEEDNENEKEIVNVNEEEEEKGKENVCPPLPLLLYRKPFLS